VFYASRIEDETMPKSLYRTQGASGFLTRQGRSGPGSVRRTDRGRRKVRWEQRPAPGCAIPDYVASFPECSMLAHEITSDR
jgi:hypothetical protein